MKTDRSMAYHFTLNTGATIPAVGLGTWQAEGDVCREAVSAALQAGYRHFDCAHLYGNEAEVGLALADALGPNDGLLREDIFVSSKVLFCHNLPKRVQQAAEASLHNLRLFYLDLFLLHWPPPINTRHVGDPTDPPRSTPPPPRNLLSRIKDTWRAMEQLVDRGLVRAIGVSNFDIPLLTQLLAFAKIVPAVNQVELHPLWRQERLVKFCQARGIHVSAHTPLGVPGSSGDDINEKEALVGHQEFLLSPRFSRSVSVHRPLLKNSYVSQVAEKLHKSPAQVVLRWGLQRGTSVLPRSLHPDRIRSNFDILNWSLSQEDWDLVDSMEPQLSLNDNLFSQPPLPHDGPLQSVDEMDDSELIDC